MACCVTVFFWSSYGASKPFSSKSLSRCDTFCSYVPFCKCVWFIDFLRCGGFSAFMNCSMIAWAATPNASFASFWSSSRKSINFCFAALKTSRWNLCFTVAIDWGSTFFLGNTVRLPNSLRWGWWRFGRFAVHHHAWGSGSNLFCVLLSVGCEFSNLVGTDFQIDQICLIVHQMWAFSLWGIWATSRLCLCCCWNWLNYCSSPIAEWLTISGLLQLSQGCFNCEFLVDL